MGRKFDEKKERKKERSSMPKHIVLMLVLTLDGPSKPSRRSGEPEGDNDTTSSVPSTPLDHALASKVALTGGKRRSVVY